MRLGVSILICVLLGLPFAASASQANTPDAGTKPARDGSHDFDFEYGKWRMPNHRLVKRLAGSHQWEDFITCDEGTPLPGGIGGMDVMHASYWTDFVGVTLRTYDPKTGQIGRASCRERVKMLVVM